MRGVQCEPWAQCRQEGGRDGEMEAQTGPVNEELRPPSGLGAGHACVLWWGSFEFSFPEFLDQ